MKVYTCSNFGALLVSLCLSSCLVGGTVDSKGRKYDDCTESSCGCVLAGQLSSAGRAVPSAVPSAAACPLQWMNGSTAACCLMRGVEVELCATPTASTCWLSPTALIVALTTTYCIFYCFINRESARARERERERAERAREQREQERPHRPDPAPVPPLTPPLVVSLHLCPRPELGDSAREMATTQWLLPFLGARLVLPGFASAYIDPHRHTGAEGMQAPPVAKPPAHTTPERGSEGAAALPPPSRGRLARCLRRIASAQPATADALAVHLLLLRYLGQVRSVRAGHTPPLCGMDPCMDAPLTHAAALCGMPPRWFSVPRGAAAVCPRQGVASVIYLSVRTRPPLRIAMLMLSSLMGTVLGACVLCGGGGGSAHSASADVVSMTTIVRLHWPLRPPRSSGSVGLQSAGGAVVVEAAPTTALPAAEAHASHMAAAAVEAHPAASMSVDHPGTVVVLWPWALARWEVALSCLIVATKGLPITASSTGMSRL